MVGINGPILSEKVMWVLFRVQWIERTWVRSEPCECEEGEKEEPVVVFKVTRAVECRYFDLLLLPEAPRPVAERGRGTVMGGRRAIGGLSVSGLVEDDEDDGVLLVEDEAEEGGEGLPVEPNEERRSDSARRGRVKSSPTLEEVASDALAMGVRAILRTLEADAMERVSDAMVDW